MTCPLPQDHIPKYDLLFSAWLVCLKEWCVCYTKRWKAVSVCVETETSKSLQIRNERADLFTALFRWRVVATIRSQTLFGRSNSVNGERIALYHGLDGSLSWTVPPSSPTVRKREESPLSHPFSVMEYVHPRKLDLKRFESTSDCERCLFLHRDCFCVKLDHPSCPILYKILVSVLNRPFLHKQNSKSCHYFLLVCHSKSENLSGHFFVSS